MVSDGESGTSGIISQSVSQSQINILILMHFAAIILLLK